MTIHTYNSVKGDTGFVLTFEMFWLLFHTPIPTSPSQKNTKPGFQPEVVGYNGVKGNTGLSSSCLEYFRLLLPTQIPTSPSQKKELNEDFNSNWWGAMASFPMFARKPKVAKVPPKGLTQDLPLPERLFTVNPLVLERA